NNWTSNLLDGGTTGKISEAERISEEWLRLNCRRQRAPSPVPKPSPESSKERNRFHGEVECPRFGGHLSAWSALSGRAGRMACHAKGIEFSEAVSAGVSARGR